MPKEHLTYLFLPKIFFKEQQKPTKPPKKLPNPNQTPLFQSPQVSNKFFEKVTNYNFPKQEVSFQNKYVDIHTLWTRGYQLNCPVLISVFTLGIIY